MPTYQYRCDKCGEDFDIYQSFSEDKLTTCPLVHGAEDSEPCGGGVKKVFGNIAVTFKGSGFYKTDSRSGSKSKSEGSRSETSSSSSDSGTSESKSSDSKSSDSKTSDSKSSDSKSSDSKSSDTKSSKTASASSSSD